MVYFSDIFNIDDSVLEEYGAFNISLLNDLPLFIDPFLLYSSEKPKYQELHNGIIKYLLFLRNKSNDGLLNEIKIKRWYCFPEVKQVWLGYSETGNGGSGFGKSFGKSMSTAITNFYKDLGKETISQSSHLEKLCLFKSGVGRDNISDFTCNLIKKYLLEYTEIFAKKFLHPNKCEYFNVDKAYFDFDLESWVSKIYYLPVFNGDYVLLTPKDILTKDENWINFGDMKYRFYQISASIPNDELRDRINDIYSRSIPAKPKEEDITQAMTRIVNLYPEVMDYYISIKENDKEGAKQSSMSKIDRANTVYIRNIQSLVDVLQQTDFYKQPPIGSYEASCQRVMFLKHVIENQDGYKLFYYKGKPVSKEKDLQLLFKFTWFASIFDVNAEVNNGRGPVDFKISVGSSDKTLVEFKLASNSKLKQNLLHQVDIYKAANQTDQSMKVILFFTESELKKLNKVLKELGLCNDPDIILIDARNKKSASNVTN